MSDFRLNRVLSRPLTGLLLRTPVTPNQVTVFNGLLGILAGVLFAQGLHEALLAGALVYQTAGVLDNCDGEIARAKDMKSELGGWLDVFGDLVTDLSLWIGLAVGLAHRSSTLPVIPLLILCLGGGLLHFTLVVLEKTKGFGPAVFETEPSRASKNVFRTAFDALREGDASWFVLLCAAAGRPDVLLCVGAVYMPAISLSALAVNFRRLAKP